MMSFKEITKLNEAKKSKYFKLHSNLFNLKFMFFISVLYI